jgi:hypothetical protein
MYLGASSLDCPPAAIDPEFSGCHWQGTSGREAANKPILAEHRQKAFARLSVRNWRCILHERNRVLSL